MKKYVVLQIFMAISFAVFGQNNIYLIDDFIDNKNNWPVYFNKNDYSSKVENSKYKLEYKNPGSMRFWKPIFLQQEKDFYIEIDIKQTDGVTNYGYGLTWGSDSWNNSYNFVISSLGSYNIYFYKNKEFIVLKKWTSHKSVKPMGQTNKLALQKQGNKLHYYINGDKVYSSDFMPFLGAKTGFVLNNKMKVEVDNITIKHPKIEINVVDNAENGKSKVRMSSNINTQYSEIAPVISPDGKTLYVARKNHPQNTSLNFYDIWVSTLKEDGTWEELKNVGKPLNNSGDNLAIALSADANTMMIEGVYNANGSHKSDQGISVSTKTKNGWSTPKEVKIQNFYNNNTYESYCPSIDRSVLIMSIERNDTYGSKDLYVSFLQNNGEYSSPKNMGTDINTYDNEGTPFLAADKKTLYFYSYIHPGYGSADIFVTKRLDNTWTKWSEPKNLGPRINTSKWDTYYTIPASGDYAYVVSMENSIGEEDIFKIKLVEDAKPEAVLFISGKVYNKSTKTPIAANVIYEDITSNEELGKAVSDPSTGEYKIVLSNGRNYGLLANADGFFPVSENIDATKNQGYKEITRDLYLSPIEVGGVVLLNNIFFDSGKYKLKQESYPELNRVFEFMKLNHTIEIEIGGHTEISHTNPVLSQNRAKVVKNYLVNRGINEKRITSVGYANRKPVIKDPSKEAQKLNRRVEFTILKK